MAPKVLTMIGEMDGCSLWRNLTPITALQQQGVPGVEWCMHDDQALRAVAGIVHQFDALVLARLHWPLEEQAAADAWFSLIHRAGLAIIYECLNRLEGVAAERVFAPWLDAEKVMREKGIPLFSLESKASLAGFDMVGFSLTNELCYTNVLNMLDLGGLKVRSGDRGEDDPLIVAGGGMANCCEPIAEFIDVFVLGEGEQAVVELAQLIREQKKAGATKKNTLALIEETFDWAYVPWHYQSGALRSAVVEDFENAPVPLAPIVPFVEAVHERVSVEIMRGCPGRCRFCQASFCRRPIRYRSVDKIIEIAKACHHATGFDTVSLLSLSSADYPKLDELVADLHSYFRDKHVGLSLPSLRVDKQLKLLPEDILTSPWNT